MVAEMLEQLKTDMMELQDKTTNKRVDKLVKYVTEYKQSLEYTQTQVEDQKKPVMSWLKCSEKHANT